MPMRLKTVREALEKVHAQGAIGTIDIPRCIEYLRTAEKDWDKQRDALRELKHVLEDVD